MRDNRHRRLKWVIAFAVAAASSQADAASVRITVAGTIDEFFWVGGEGSQAPVTLGTSWLLTGVLGDRAESLHTYGRDLIGHLFIGGSLYISFEAAQVEYDTANREDDENEWSISVENETPDNPHEVNPLPGFLFGELLISALPWWANDEAPPVGTSIPAGFEPRLFLSLSAPANQGAFLGGRATDFIVAGVPEPGVAALLGLATWLTQTRRRRSHP